MNSDATPARRGPVDVLWMLLVTAGGLGRAPFAPGTFGTLGGVGLAVLVQWLAPPDLTALVLGALAAVLLAVGCAATGFVGRAMTGKDPGAFVLDEVVGYLAAVTLYTALRGELDVLGHCVAFGAFRLFDITKVPPANRLERLPGAVGIMLDDVMAGLYAGAVMLVVLPMLE